MQVAQARTKARSPAAAVTLADARRVAALAEKTAKALHANEKARRKTVRPPAAARPAATERQERIDEGTTASMARDLLGRIGRLARPAGRAIR